MTEVARPLGDRIVVKRDEVQTVTQGGIHLPQNKRQQPTRGEVVAVGPGAYNQKGERIPMTLKAGDRVIFGTYAGTEISVNGDKYQIMREGDVVCVIDGDGAEIETAETAGPRSGSHEFYQ